MKITDVKDQEELDNLTQSMPLFGGTCYSYLSVQVINCNKLYELAVEAEFNNNIAAAMVYMEMYLEQKEYLSNSINEYSLSLLEKDGVKFIH